MNCLRHPHPDPSPQGGGEPVSVSDNMTLRLSRTSTLPADGVAGTLVGRVWRPDVEGPSVVILRDDGLHDITAAFPTMRDLCETSAPATAARNSKGERIGDLEAILANSPEATRDAAK